MKALLPIIRLLLAAAPQSMARGAVLSVVTLLMGIALLGLSGWFITAAGIAGLAGIGIAFDVFRPSAGVRFLALGRTVARYGERLLTHDATLHALAALRVMLLRRQAQQGARALASLRSEGVLTRIVSDIDALDGVILRLLLPSIAALVCHFIAFLALGLLVSWGVAGAVLAGYLPLAIIIVWYLASHTRRPSDAVEVHSQSLRRGVIDMMRDRQSLILTAILATREMQLLEIDTQTRRGARTLDRVERRAGAVLSILVAVVTAIALVLGENLINADRVSPAVAAIAVFVALALAETLLPLQRGFADFGRMLGAAQRITESAKPLPVVSAGQDRSAINAPLLKIQTANLAFSLEAGNVVAFTGPSGSGKTTLMLQIAGLAASEGVTILGLQPQGWPESGLRERVTMVPQRSALIAGTVRENMRLASDARDDQIWQALKAVALDEVIKARGGLDVYLNEAGAGLSGGQARRLVLARAILKRPQLLLLDEPTEGMDSETANRVLQGIRKALPNTAILASAHRFVEHPVFDRQITFC